MPKLRKEKRDEVIRYINEGYTNAEIHEKTGVSRTTIGKIKKEITVKDSKETSKKTQETQLSPESLRKIGLMQGMLGGDTLDKTIDILYEDIRTLTQLKYKYDDSVEKTPAQVIKHALEKQNLLDASKNIIDRGRTSFFHQNAILFALGLNHAVKAFYDLTSPPKAEFLLGFMEDAVIGSFKEKGWDVRYYWDEITEEKQPIIITPSGQEFKFPFYEE